MLVKSEDNARRSTLIKPCTPPVHLLAWPFWGNTDTYLDVSPIGAAELLRGTFVRWRNSGRSSLDLRPVESLIPSIISAPVGRREFMLNRIPGRAFASWSLAARSHQHGYLRAPWWAMEVAEAAGRLEVRRAACCVGSAQTYVHLGQQFPHNYPHPQTIM